MKITLRKASAVQNAIQETVKSVEVKVQVTLNEFEDVSVALASANAVTVSNDQRRAALTACLYDIRSLVGSANTLTGINDRLAKSAYIDKRIGQLTGLTSADAVQESLAVVTGKVDKLKVPDTTGRRSLYGYNDTVTTGVLSSEQVASYKAQILDLKKQKQKLTDEILELNVRTEIDLPAEVVTALTAEGLV